MRASWSRPGLGRPERLQQLHGLGRLHVHEVHLELGVEEHRVGRRHELTQGRVQLRVGELVLVEVEHVDERLGRQQPQPLRLGEVDPRSGARGIQGVAFLEDLLGGHRVVEQRLGLLLDPRLLLQARARPSPGSAGRRGSARCGWSRCRTPARPCRRRGRRRRPRRRGRPGRSRRPRGCSRGTCCPAPRPRTRPARCPRCRRTTPWRAGCARSRRSPRAPPRRASGSGTTPTLGSIVANG